MLLGYVRMALSLTVFVEHKTFSNLSTCTNPNMKTQRQTRIYHVAMKYENANGDRFKASVH